jgi:hypothetical protein
MRFLPIISLLILTSACIEEQKEASAVVQYQRTVSNFASGSGMEYYEGYFWAVGDDSPYLYKLDSMGLVKRVWQIWPLEHLEGGRIKKKQKPDFEAVAIEEVHGEPHLFIFGSGSKPPQRDVIIWGSMNNLDSLKTIDATHLYNHIRVSAHKNSRQLNIEGAMFFENHLILLNRNGNELYRLDKQRFFESLSQPSDSLIDVFIDKTVFKLPKIESLEGTFSGACLIPGTSKMLFTASVERTNDWVDDGAILGSFVGIIDLNDLTSNSPIICVAVSTPEGEIYKGKIEAPAVSSNQSKPMQLFAITDDDEVETEFLHISIKP